MQTLQRPFLVPVDFSENPHQTAHYAAGWARQLQQALHLHKTLNPFRLISRESDHERNLHPEHTENLLREAGEEEGEKLRRLAEEIYAQTEGDVAPTYEVIAGPAEEVLLDRLKAKKYIPVFGASSRNDFFEILFGSQHLNVISQLKDPALLVPDHWTYNSPETILYASDEKHADVEDIRNLVHWARRCDARLLLLHAAPTKRSLPTAKEFIAKVGQEVDYDKMFAHVESGTALPRTVESFVSTHKVDIMAVHQRQVGFLEDLFAPDASAQLAWKTPLPLLFFPAK